MAVDREESALGAEHQQAPAPALGEYPVWVRLWFAIDALAALLPPIHWWLTDHAAFVLGWPVSLVYFLALALCISASIVAAYVAESRWADLDETGTPLEGAR